MVKGGGGDAVELFLFLSFFFFCRGGGGGGQGGVAASGRGWVEEGAEEGGHGLRSESRVEGLGGGMSEVGRGRCGVRCGCV